ncbi:cytochrome P450 [Frankia sp. AgPm24]|uniref:cytochrome P450 n=1 Tax=Frankia sp. AgPm24 TaxID=631128 RepID=UPI00200D2642|nr:cytochrome P450 [Frankia sp. AgPm24]MCK9922756.1 cytochrome P450 [Frankia sp. AgPm24]
MSGSVSVAPLVSSREFWGQPAAGRAAHFAELRRDAPIVHCEPSAFSMAPQQGGFWAVTRHRDVQLISRRPDLFRSGAGVGIGELPPEFLELNASFLVMDPPRHTALRKIVSGAFTPRQVGRLEAAITAKAHDIVDEFVERGGGDVVAELSTTLPLWTISTMMGVPESMREEFRSAAEGQIAAQDPDFSVPGKESSSVALESAQTLHRLAAELVADRRRNPGDDILSMLLEAEFEGAPIDDTTVRCIFVLFATAGNDTTRTSTSQGMRLFAEHPDQWQRLLDDPSLLGTAIEEIVRYSSPVIHFRRTATQDTELGGVAIAAGEPVVMFYESANHDESVFAQPAQFDIGRDPNPHVGFGGGGPHFCLGVSLARRQLRSLFGRLVERVGGIEAGPADFLTSNFVNGVKRLPATVTAR